MPADKQKFIKKALERGADAIQLDLEDGVAPESKQIARNQLKESIKFLSQGNVEVLVRINHDMVEKDIDAAVYPGLDGLVLPKVDSTETIVEIESKVVELEKKRGVQPGKIHFTVLIESAKGFMNLKEILASSPRIIAVNLGTEDFTLDLGIEPSKDGDELVFPKMYLQIAAKAAGVQPIGLIGSMADFNDLANLEKVAKRSHQYGFVGASCIHPSQVSVLNDAFTPTKNDVEYAKRVIDAFEKANANGDGAVQLDGKMIDLPVAERAYKTFEKFKRINSKEKGNLIK